VSIHTVYLVSDLEGIDNGDPINGIVYCLSCKSRSSHGLGYFSGLVNKCEEVLFYKPKCSPFAAERRRAQLRPIDPRMPLRLPRPSIKGLTSLLRAPKVSEVEERAVSVLVCGHAIYKYVI
jgi:hypothetical protein